MKNRVKTILKANPKDIIFVVPDKRVVAVGGDNKKTEHLYLGENDFSEVFQLILEEIETRPDPKDRVQFWECVDANGVYHSDLEDVLLKARN